MGQKYKEYTDPDGNKYRKLPKKWHNCSPLNDELVLLHGWTIQQKQQQDPQPIDESSFKAACKQFREVCKQIGIFIGNETFKGGFDEYSEFINSEAAKNDSAKAALLASMWAGANEYCKYQGSKIGYNQPEWWYKCWEYSDQDLN